jgi:hypothetical protein
MLFHQVARVITTVHQPILTVQRQQRRTLLNWMTNYPNRVRTFWFGIFVRVLLLLLLLSLVLAIQSGLHTITVKSFCCRWIISKSSREL